MSIEFFEQKPIKLIFPYTKELKRALELIGLPHLLASKEFIVVEKENAIAFLANLGISKKEDFTEAKNIFNENKSQNVLDIINAMSELKIKDKCGLFIGARMGRPEKAKMRKLTGTPHMLFQ